MCPGGNVSSSPPDFPPIPGLSVCPTGPALLQVPASGVTSPLLVTMPKSSPLGWKCNWKWSLVAELHSRGWRRGERKATFPCSGNPGCPCGHQHSFSCSPGPAVPSSWPSRVLPAHSSLPIGIFTLGTWKPVQLHPLCAIPSATSTVIRGIFLHSMSDL